MAVLNAVATMDKLDVVQGREITDEDLFVSFPGFVPERWGTVRHKGLYEEYSRLHAAFSAGYRLAGVRTSPCSRMDLPVGCEIRLEMVSSDTGLSGHIARIESDFRCS